MAKVDSDSARIQPLEIVDRDDHRARRGQRAQNSQRRDRHRSPVRWSTLDLCSEERSVQLALLRGRQIRKLKVKKVTQRRVGESGL